MEPSNHVQNKSSSNHALSLYAGIMEVPGQPGVVVRAWRGLARVVKKSSHLWRRRPSAPGGALSPAASHRAAAGAGQGLPGAGSQRVELSTPQLPSGEGTGVRHRRAAAAAGAAGGAEEIELASPALSVQQQQQGRQQRGHLASPFDAPADTTLGSQGVQGSALSATSSLGGQWGGASLSPSNSTASSAQRAQRLTPNTARALLPMYRHTLLRLRTGSLESAAAAARRAEDPAQQVLSGDLPEGDEEGGSQQAQLNGASAERPGPAAGSRQGGGTGDAAEVSKAYLLRNEMKGVEMGYEYPVQLGVIFVPAAPVPCPGYTVPKPWLRFAPLTHPRDQRQPFLPCCCCAAPAVLPPQGDELEIRLSQLYRPMIVPSGCAAKLPTSPQEAAAIYTGRAVARCASLCCALLGMLQCQHWAGLGSAGPTTPGSVPACTIPCS